MVADTGTVYGIGHSISSISYFTYAKNKKLVGYSFNPINISGDNWITNRLSLIFYSQLISCHALPNEL